MRLTHLTFGCAVVAMLLSTAQAQRISDHGTMVRPVSTTSYYEELEAVNAELAELKARFATLEESGASGTGLLVGHSVDSGKGACSCECS